MYTPHTSFPGLEQPDPVMATNTKDPCDLDAALHSFLINSDPSECNQNLSIYIKLIIDNVYNVNTQDNGRTYHSLSIHALKLLNSNMFVKNYRFCIGKILAFLSALTHADPTPADDPVTYEKECLKEFLCIVLLLLLKIKNEPPSKETSGLDLIEYNQIIEALQEYDFVITISNFISSNVISINDKNSDSTSFILLKFSCDILFEYLYHIILLTNSEFDDLTNRTNLIPTLIKYLLSNENFNHYDIFGDSFQDELKLIAYEQFKLLLFINEQYLMKSYSCQVPNKVFEGLMLPDNNNCIDDHSKITGFINLIIYHLNREDSRIIKILILKFLYLVFTTSYTVKLIYMNDLRILVEIFIREMNDLDYTTESENVILLLAYLKVLHPLLRFSQMKDVEMGHKKKELVQLLENIVSNVDSGSPSQNDNQSEDRASIAKLAAKCKNIDWLNPQSQTPLPQATTLKHPKHSDSKSQEDSSDLDANISTDSLDISLNRRPSVRTSSRSDFYNHRTSNHRNSVYEDNNNNVFLSEKFKSLAVSTPVEPPWTQPEQNVLDIPQGYLANKALPKLPVPIPVPQRKQAQFYKNDGSSSSSVNSASSLVRKALKKKAPPPPPSPQTSNSSRKNSTSPPLPPPPRRRK